MNTTSNDSLAKLAAVIESRKGGDPDTSYVARLLSQPFVSLQWCSQLEGAAADAVTGKVFCACAAACDVDSGAAPVAAA